MIIFKKGKDFSSSSFYFFFFFLLYVCWESQHKFNATQGTSELKVICNNRMISTEERERVEQFLGPENQGNSIKELKEKIHFEN